MNLLREIVLYETALILSEIRTGFDIRHFKNLDSLKDMHDYASGKLKFLGKGSSRTTYLLSNRYALKLANLSGSEGDSKSMDKGLAQNRIEVDVWTDPRTKPIVTEVYDFDDQYRWLISEVVRPFNREKDFEEAAGFPFSLLESRKGDIELNIEEVTKRISELEKKLGAGHNSINSYERRYAEEDLKYFLGRRERLKKALKAFEENEKFLNAVTYLVQQQGILAGDVYVEDHWGKTADGRIVLLDYGFNDESSKLYW